ncbi:MAG TPA: PilZ domain-containing protein [Gemmataceae bacterium]|nr:PilZ domain-containing protein [Gemmataceae bacterium]
MMPHAILADITTSPWLGVSFVVPVAVGLAAGLGVVGFIHFIWRPRRAAALAAPKEEQPSDPFIHGSQMEQRKSFRRIGNPIGVLIIDQSRPGEPMKGQVINRSVGGLCILMDRPIEADTPLTVRPTNAPHIAPWVAVVAKNSREGEMGIEVGCQFVKTPPWPVLMMFG